MSATTKGVQEEVRMNALWGKGERDGARRATVRPRASVFAALVAVLALAAPMTASAGNGNFVYTAPSTTMLSTSTSTSYDLAYDDAAWNSVAWSDAAWYE